MDGRVPTPVVGSRAAAATDDLRGTLAGYYRFYSGYDPIFSWWAADPYKKADEALRAHSAFLRERVVGVRPGQEEPIIGDPIGAGGMASDLTLVRCCPTPPRSWWRSRTTSSPGVRRS
jgi:hypothetical protein